MFFFMSSNLFFLKNFFKDKNIAALTPTFMTGVKKVCEKIDFSKDSVFVEYGPGDGVFTHFLLEKMTPNSKLIGIDTNKDFVEFLRKIGDPRLHVVHDTAENIQKILADCNVPAADYVLSGIPFTFFTPALREEVVHKTWNSLSIGGKFLVYQYSPLMLKELQKYFKTSHLDTLLLHIPPLFIMEAIK